MGRDSEHVDTVIVGSGFGGSVAAYRLAEAGRDVVVLERGRPYPPGSFPRTPQEMQRNVWDPSEGRYGMFHIWRFNGFDSLAASGLGGGSLIYANVLARKDERWFVREEPMPGGGYESWPITRADLDPHYQAVEQMLGATPYPLRAPAYRATPKTHAMISAAEKNDLAWELPPLGVSFAANAASDPALGVPITPPPYGNIHGSGRRTCRLTGECTIGCNEGAKNTLDHTYLSAAQHRGAQIRTRSEVRDIRPLDSGGYAVTYVRHDPERRGGPHDSSRLPTTTITCKRLILGAGAYGTPYLLMRNRSALPGLSHCLGTRFSGNGDLLTFLLPRGEDSARRFDPGDGPVITAAVRVPDGAGGHGRGYTISEGGYPGFVDWLVESSDLTGTAFRLGETVVRWVLDRVTGSAPSHLGAEVSRIMRDGTLAAGALPLLALGRDVPDGVMKLRDDRLEIDWPAATSAAYAAGVRATMRELAGSLDADLLDDAGRFFRRVLTVHPVGGAPMGRDDTEGVCDQYGGVFGHPGLYVADGSVMPGPVGTHPALTIAAHADRMATHILSATRSSRTGRAGTARAGAGTARTAGAASARPRATTVAATATSRAARSTLRSGAGARQRSGTRAGATALTFTEEMTGFFAFDTAEPASGERLGRELDQPLTLHLTISTDDAERFLAQPARAADAQGRISSDALGGELVIERGTFNLYVPADRPDTRRMSYRLYFVDGAGQPMTLSGRKEVRDDSILDTWLDTSTLFYRLFAGHVSEAREASAVGRGAGVGHIRPSEFTRQLASFRTDGPAGDAVLGDFGHLFMGQLWDVYGMRSGPAGTRPPSGSRTRVR